MRRDLPSGTVTFLFTDVEGSTRLLHALGAEAYAAALAEHRRVIREACAAEGGVEVDTQGDAFFFAFPSAPGAITAASAFTDGLASGPVQVRVGLHTGTPLLTEEGYVGDDVHFAARVASAAHGGQVILSSGTARLVDDDLTELGEHRLKDIAEPVAIYQLGGGAFPPLKTISNTNLPRPASSFVGREREVEEVRDLLADGTRLLTLTGPGGSGKTRLAIEAAATLVPEYKAGVFWVGLASLRDHSLVTETIAQTLGSRNGLAEHIGGRELLLLLDNLEQVVEAAPELAALVTSCPNLTLLVTSRERLRVSGEVEYEVPPLEAPEGVSLFCERSRLEPSDEIAELCARLDSLPLALELAAARCKALSPAQILARLSQRLDLLQGGRDADPRQQTLRATIEWSHELLTAQEQQLFARLSVFAGGCTLAAAEEICAADLDTLHSLVEKSLLRFGNERYWLLETIREYAAERLEQSGAAETVRQRHAEWFLALTEEAEPDVERYPEKWLERLEGELDNFRAALDHLDVSGDSQLGLRLAGALMNFWEGHVTEGAQRLETLLSCDERATPARAKALVAAALMARQGGDPASARLRAGEALTLYRTLDDVGGAANAGLVLGLAAADEDDFRTARQLFEESATLFGDSADERNAMFATRLLGWMHEELGDVELARAVHEQNLERARSAGDTQIEGQTLGALGYLALAEHRTRDAILMYQDVLRIDRDRGVRGQTQIDLCRFARALALAGDADADAARLLSCAEAIREETGFGTPPYLLAMIEEAIALVRPRLGDAAFTLCWEEGTALTADEAIALALGESHPDA